MVEIDLPQGIYKFTRVVPLDGISYTFRFDWNIRLEYWSYGVFLPNGEALLQGQRLMVSADLLNRFSFTEAPKELLFLYDTEQKNEEPTFEGLGTRWRLMYGNPV